MSNSYVDPPEAGQIYLNKKQNTDVVSVEEEDEEEFYIQAESALTGQVIDRQ